MRVMAQMAMVMNLDKCIGCHTCSVTCKQAWTNRSGTEYIWFNNVETKPGLGYPRTYEDQEKWKGGWELNQRGRLKLKGGGRFKKLLTIFSNPDLPARLLNKAELAPDVMATWYSQGPEGYTDYPEAEPVFV